MEPVLLGDSPEWLSVVRAARIVAVTDASVLLLGESGTGKDLLARLLHARSARASGPFVAVNCAALPEALAEAELFGHSKGAFTGAQTARTGKIPAAQRGTLFLDEIGELPQAMQAKLLRFLESGECPALGCDAPKMVNTRVIAATNRELAREVRLGNFRADLYYRLNVVPLELPPLRQRGGDVALLALALTAELSQRHGIPAPNYTKAALVAMQGYAWPGNVRELRNFCERMLILHSGQAITPAQLPREVHAREARIGLQPENDFALPEQGVDLDSVEHGLIRQALRQTRGNRSKAAELLGISRDKLLYRMKKHAITL